MSEDTRPWLGEIARRELPDGRLANVYPLVMGTARISVWQPGSGFVDNAW